MLYADLKIDLRIIMNKCEIRTWWLITIAISLLAPFLFNAAIKSIYQYINPIGVEIVSYVQTKQMSSEEKATYLLTLLNWDLKLIPVLIYALIILAIVALIISLFFVRNLYLKVGLIIVSLVSFALAYYNYIIDDYTRGQVVPRIVKSLEAQKTDY
jgi:hypothetical protein